MAGLSYGSNYGTMGLYGTQPLTFGGLPSPAVMSPFGGDYAMGNPVSIPAPTVAPTIAAYGSPAVTTVASTTSPVAPTTPGVDADPTKAWDDRNWLGKTIYNKEGGLNLGGIKDIVSIVGALGSLWGSFQQNKLAKDAFKFEKQAYQTNLANTISSYNLGLEDRITSRYAQEGRPGEAQTFIDKHKL